MLRPRIQGMLLVCLLFVSCATSRQMTREEYLAIGKKSFKNIDKESLIKAAQDVLTLVDGKDFKFAYTPNGFIATRSWFVYAILAATKGNDYWTFEIEVEGDSLVASLHVSTTAGSIVGYSANPGISTVTSPTIGEPIQGTAIYDVFWGRLDYVLGRTDKWINCDLAQEKIRQGVIWGDTDQICGSITISDELPPNLSDEEISRIFKKDDKGKWYYLKKNKPNSKLFLEMKMPKEKKKSSR